MDSMNQPILELNFPQNWTQLESSELYYNKVTDMISFGPVFDVKDMQRVLEFEEIAFDKEFMIKQIKELNLKDKRSEIAAAAAPVFRKEIVEQKKNEEKPLIQPSKSYFTNDVPSEISLAIDPVNITSQLAKKTFKLILSIDLIQKGDKSNKFLIKIGNSNFAEYQVGGDHKIGKKKVALKLLSQIAPNVFKQVCKKQNVNQNYISQVKINKIYAKQSNETKKQSIMLERFQDDDEQEEEEDFNQGDDQQLLQNQEKNIQTKIVPNQNTTTTTFNYFTHREEEDHKTLFNQHHSISRNESSNFPYFQASIFQQQQTSHHSQFEESELQENFIQNKEIKLQMDDYCFEENNSKKFQILDEDQQEFHF